MSSLFHPVQILLDKLAKLEDVDVRFMALRDLAKELNKMATNMQSTDPSAAAATAAGAATPPPPPALDQRAQEKLCRVLQVQLLCTQGEVAEAAVRCLPGLLCAVGDTALSSLLDHLLRASFAPQTALPPEHLQAEEVADDREREARLESIRLKALQAMKVLWREMAHAEPRERVARQIVPPVIKLVQQTTEGKATANAAGSSSSSSQPSVASMLQTPQLPFPKLSLGQLLDFVPFLHALLSAHPSSLVSFHAALLSLFHSLLLFEGSGLLGLTMECVNATAPYLSTESIAAFVQMLCDSWNTFQSRKRESAFFAAIGTIVRVTGNAFQPYLSQVLPMLHEVLDTSRYESAQEERESALLCVEHIARSASAAALPHLLSLLPSIERAASYDPNFVGDAHDAELSAAQHAPMSTGAGVGDDDDGEEEDYGLGGGDDDEDNGLNDFVDDGASDGNVSDDEDSSWKVRRASARCVNAIIGTVMVVSGSANEQQQQAFATALPPLYVSSHASANRPIVEHLTSALSNLLLPRLTERTDHIQTDLLSHYEQLLLWASRCPITKHLDLTNSTAGGPSLQQQLGRLLGAAVKAKPSTADLRCLEHVALLLSTATRAVPAARWTIEHAHVFRLLTLRATECFALLLPGAHAHSHAHVLPVLVHCATAFQHAWSRLPSAVWASEATAWSSLMFKQLGSLKQGDRTAASPMLALNLACVRALTALIPAVRQACSELTQASLVQSLQVLPYSQMDASLESMRGARCPDPVSAVPDGAGSWMLTAQASVSLMGDIQRSCVSMLQDARADRSLQSQAVQCMTRLWSVLVPLTLGSGAAPPPLLADSQPSVWSTMLRLCDFPTTRVVACEAFHAQLSVVQPMELASVQRMLQPLVPMLNQRDRPLLRAAMLALRTFVARTLSSHAQQRDTEAMWPTLQQAVLPILAFCTESGEFVVEQSCALVLLANILQLLLLSAPLRSSTHSLLVTHVFPTLVEWLAAHPSVDLLTIQAMQHVYAAAAPFAHDAQQHSEWTTALRAQASHATEESTRTSLSALLAALLFCARSSSTPLADLGAPLCLAHLSSDESKQLTDIIGEEAKHAANADLPVATRIVAMRVMGHLLYASVGNHSPVVTTAAGSASSLLLSLAMSTDAVSPLSVAASESLGYVCALKSEAELRTLVSLWHDTPSAQLNVVFSEFTRLMAAAGIVNVETTGSVPTAGGAATLASSSSSAVAAVPPTVLAHADSARRLNVSRLQPLLSPLLSSALVALHAPQVDVSVLSQLLSNLCLLAPSAYLQATAPLFCTPLSTQRALGADPQQAMLRALQRFVEQQHAQSKQWKLRLSNHPSSVQQDAIWDAVGRAFSASVVLFNSTDLSLLVRCVELAHAVTSLQPALVVPHLRQLVSVLSKLSLRQGSHVREVSYGPSTKSVDTGIELRLAVWRAIVAASALLSLQAPRALEDATMCATLCGMLLGGLSDPAAEVKLAVHTALLQLTQRITLPEAQWAQMAEALATSIQAPPPENAVQEEVLVHSEVIASATRTGAQFAAMVAQMERFPSTKHSGVIAHARMQLQQVVEAQQNEQKRRHMHKA